MVVLRPLAPACCTMDVDMMHVKPILSILDFQDASRSFMQKHKPALYTKFIGPHETPATSPLFTPGSPHNCRNCNQTISRTDSVQLYPR